MSLWDNILTGFDPEDETRNFGTRLFAETQSAIYETETLATIQASDKDSLVSLSPQVLSTFNETGGLAIVVDQSLSVFSSDCSVVRISASFDSTVEALFLAPEFIFLGLSNASLICLHLPTDGTLIFSLNLDILNNIGIVSGSRCFSDIICRESGDQTEIIVVSATGDIYGIVGFNPYSINEALAVADSEALEKIKKNFKLVQLSKSKSCAIDMCYLQEHSLTLLAGGNRLRMLPSDSNNWAEVYHFEQDISVKKILSSIPSLIVCLTSDGSLLFCCPYTLQLMFTWCEIKIHDCTVLESNFQGSKVHKILALTASQVEPELILMSLRGFEVEFHLKIKKHSYLVENQSACENILFLEGYGEGRVDTIRVKSLIETQPQYSLNRMLQKGKFEEAKMFAARYKLDFELIHMAKANWLMGELEPWKKSRNVHITELIETLESIKDDKFVLECCTKTIPPDMSSTESLLCYAMKRLQNARNKDESFDNLMNNISDLLLRLGTFMQICKDHERTPEQWLTFSIANMITVCQQHLSKGEIREAVIICTRHWSHWLLQFGRECALPSKIHPPEHLGIIHLKHIPSFVTIKDVNQWLECFIPKFLAAQPHMLPQMVNWVEDKTKCLELAEPDAWPEVGIEFCTGILKLLISVIESTSCSDSLVRLRQGMQRSDSPLNQMHSVIVTLCQLSTLKHKHSIRIPFDKFARDPKDKEGRKEVLWLLFDNVPVEGIKNLLDNFVELYCTQSFIEVDSAIAAYVKKVCASLSWWGSEANNIESRVISLINCIKCLDLKMESILNLTRDAPVPWTTAVEGLVEKAVQLKHQLSGEIYLQKSNLAKKMVLKKYDLPLNMVLSELVYFIRYIYKQGHEEMLEDAKTLVGSESSKSYLDIYVYYFLKCIEDSCVEKGLSILDSELSKDQQITVYDRILFFLRTKNRFEKDRYYYKDILPAIISRVSKLDSSLHEQYNNLKAAEILKVEFNMKVDFRVIGHPTVRQQILQDCTKKILEAAMKLKDNSKVENESDFVVQVCRVASLLNFSNEESIVELALFCSSNLETLNFCTGLVRELISMETFDKCDPSQLFVLACAMLLRFTNISDPCVNIANDVYELLCQVIARCKPYNMWKFLQLMKVARLFSDPPTKPIYEKFYDDSFESSSLSKLPKRIIPVLVNGISSFSSEIGSEIVPDQFIEIIKTQPSTLASLRNVFTLYSLGSTMLCLDARALKFASDSVMKIVSDLGLKVVSAQHLDTDLALHILNFFEPENAIQWLLNISKGVSNRLRNLRAVSLVGREYCKLHDMDQYIGHFNDLYTTCKWAQKLYKYGIPTREVFKDASLGKNQLLMRLMDMPGAELPLLWEYCADMQIDQHECVVLYLERTLLKWNPVFKVVTNHESGRPDIIFETNREKLLRECWRIMASIANPENVLEHFMRSFWSRVNYYNYECFDVIIKLIEAFYSPKVPQDIYGPQKLLLSFLNNYVRISAPQEQEVENWFRNFPDSQRIPPISSYRLPFTPLPPEQWEFIRPELSLSTYKLWLEAPAWFNVILNKDLICTITINNLKNEEISRSGWEVNFTKKKLMEQIMECIGHIRSLAMSTTALYFVVNHVLPQGVDQVDAVQKCYMHAQEWDTMEGSQNSHEGLMKAKKKYLTISTMYILHKHGLGRPEYLNLVLEPTELISALYNDPSILQRTSTHFSVLPDINKAVECIAALHNVNIIAIRFELLSEWLQPDNSLHCFNETIPSNNSNELLDSENIKRASYVLSADVYKSGSYLVGLAFPRSDESTGPAVGVRLRALTCLLQITTSEEMETISARTLPQIRAYKLSLELVCELERLGMSCSVACFDSYSKPELIRVLLARDQEPAALQLAARICTTYSINSPQFWNQIFNRMTSLAMFTELGKLLPQTLDIFPLLDQDILAKAWNQVIISYVSKGGCDTSTEGKVVELLTACPVVGRLDTEAILERLGNSDVASIITRQLKLPVADNNSKG